MKTVKKLLAGMLAAALVMTGIFAPAEHETETVKVVLETVEAADDPGAVITQSRTESEFNASFLSLTGFASADIDTTTTEAIESPVNDRLWAIGTDAYATVSIERDFLQALMDARRGNVSVIEITEDLDLGWDGLALTSEEQSAYSCIAEYGQSVAFTIYNPLIAASGISQLTISGTDGLTIFSRAGVTVSHAEWKLQGTASDIVIRNIKFDDMWSFNDSTEEDTKAAGWTPIKINGAKGVWIDHCTVTRGYDGCVDSENGAASVTISWCDMGMDSDAYEDTSGPIYATYSYLHLLYEAGQLGENSVFASLMNTYGDTQETLDKLMAYACYHHKFNLNGSGDADFKDGYDSNGNRLEDGQQRIHITMAYNKVSNIASRYPLLRQGTMHYINCYLDNSGHVAASSALGKSSGSTAISARNGASVAVDTCIYNEVSTVVSNNELQLASGVTKAGWEVAFENAYNHVMIVNSRTTYNGVTYDGNSYDNNGDNRFFRGNSSFWNGGKITMTDFRWFSHIVNEADDELYTKAVVPTDAYGIETAFEIVYSGDDEAEDGWYLDNSLPYTYQTVALDDVEETVETYAGAYTFNEGPEFWLATEYSVDDVYEPVSADTVVEVESISLNEESYVTYEGEFTKLTAKISPSNATDKTITWSSDNEKVATVNEAGIVTAVSSGTAIITAAVADGKSVSCEVTVSVPVTSITIEGTPSNGYIYLDDGTVTLSASVSPENASDTSVTWKSSNTRYLTVDENGVLTPVAAGKNITITCTSVSNPSVTATVKLTVKEGSAPIQSEDPDPSEPAESETPAVLYGDVNLDGEVDVSDALDVLKHYVNLSALTGEALTAADVNLDGQIDVSDALLILKYYVNLVEELPAI